MNENIQYCVMVKFRLNEKRQMYDQQVLSNRHISDNYYLRSGLYVHTKHSLCIAFSNYVKKVQDNSE